MVSFFSFDAQHKVSNHDVECCGRWARLGFETLPPFQERCIGKERVVMGRLSDQARQSSRAPGAANQRCPSCQRPPHLTNGLPNTLLNKKGPWQKSLGKSIHTVTDGPRTRPFRGGKRLFTRNRIMRMPSGRGRLPLNALRAPDSMPRVVKLAAPSQPQPPME